MRCANDDRDGDPGGGIRSVAIPENRHRAASEKPHGRLDYFWCCNLAKHFYSGSHQTVLGNAGDLIKAMPEVIEHLRFHFGAHRSDLFFVEARVAHLSFRV